MSDKVLTVHVISPEKILYTGEADYVRIPGVMGSFGVMFNHASLVSEMEIGVLEVKNGDQRMSMVIDGGFVQVRNNVVNILANSGDTKEVLKLDVLRTNLQKLVDSKAPSEEIKKVKTRLSLLEK
ncbi:MAG: ATP synthase F1 subunit epsilon [Leptospiraceae bacterium]|nr:ATP synthase F1 subunit epsilon [Leptospiraceae bacterium]